MVRGSESQPPSYFALAEMLFCKSDREYPSRSPVLSGHSTTPLEILSVALIDFKDSQKLWFLYQRDFNGIKSAWGAMIHIKILKITTSIVLFLQILRLPSHRQPTKNRLLVKKEWLVLSLGHASATGAATSHPAAFAPCVFMGVRKTSQLGVRDRAAASTQALGPMSMVHPSTTRRARCTWGQHAGSPSNPKLSDWEQHPR